MKKEVRKTIRKVWDFIEKNSKSNENFQIQSGNVVVGGYLVEVNSHTSYKVIEYDFLMKGSITKTYECNTSGWVKAPDIFKKIRLDLKKF